MSTTTTTTITTITPTSANAGTPTKVTKRHSTSGLKSAGFTMSKLSGCGAYTCFHRGRVAQHGHG